MNSADLDQLRRAVQAAPEDADARLALLQALVTAEAWQEAEAVGTVLLRTATPPATVHAMLALVYDKCQRRQDAVQQCQQALEAQPDDGLLLFNLGTLLAQQGDAAGLEYLEKAVAQRDDWAEAHYNLGTVLLRQGRYSEAIKAFERAIAQRDAYPEAHFNCGNAHAMQGLAADGTLGYYELDCAITAYKTAMQQRPGYTAALYNLGLVYGRMTSAEGLRVWDQYLEASRDKPDEEPWRGRAPEYKRDLQDRLH